MLYRPQRGSFQASMMEVTEVRDGAELLEILRKQLAPLPVSEFTLRHYCYDDRNGWETHLVVIDGKGVGYTNQDLH